MSSIIVNTFGDSLSGHASVTVQHDVFGTITFGAQPGRGIVIEEIGARISQFPGTWNAYGIAVQDGQAQALLNNLVAETKGQNVFSWSFPCNSCISLIGKVFEQVGMSKGDVASYMPPGSVLHAAAVLEAIVCENPTNLLNKFRSEGVPGEIIDLHTLVYGYPPETVGDITKLYFEFIEQNIGESGNRTDYFVVSNDNEASLHQVGFQPAVSPGGVDPGVLTPEVLFGGPDVQTFPLVPDGHIDQMPIDAFGNLLGEQAILLERQGFLI